MMNNDTVFVSVLGSDKNDGSFESPFRTIEHAVDCLKNRAINTIIIRKGVYVVDNEIELKNLANITIEAYGDEKVSIVGAKNLSFEKFTPVKDEVLKNKLPENALEYNLKDERISDYGALFARGFRRPYAPAPMELVIDGEVMKTSCYPKKGYFSVGEVVDPGAISVNTDSPDFSNRGGSFKFDDKKVSGWEYTDDILVSGYLACGFADDTIPVKRIDTVHQIIELSSAVMYGVKSNHCTKYKFVNVLDELSEEKEYYIDRKNGKLYFIPPKNFNKKSSICVTMTTKPLISLINTRNVTIQNITVMNTRGIGIYMEQGAGNTLKNITIKNIGIVGIDIGKGVAPDKEYRHHYYTGEPVSKELGSWHEHIYNDVLFNRDAGINHLVTNCVISDCGSGGISLGGGDRKTLISANNRVENCIIHDCNRLDKTYKALINIDGVGNVISHCELYNASHSAIYLHGNEHLIEYNEVYNTCTETDDSGAFYMGADPSEQHNVIRFNYFHDITTVHRPTVPLRDGMGVFAIYNDDGASGTVIFGNIFCRIGTWAIHNNCCRDIKIENNIFVECQTAVVHGDRFWGKIKDDPFMIEGGVIYERLKNQVHFDRPPYSEKYPTLKEYFDYDGQPVKNTFKNNIIYRCLNSLSLRHKDEWYINDYYLVKEGETYLDVLKKYRGWYEQMGNYVIDEHEALQGKEVDYDILQRDDILSNTLNFERISWSEIGNKGGKELC